MTFSATATVFAIAHRFVWRERDAGVAPNSLVDGSWRLGILSGRIVAIGNLGVHQKCVKVRTPLGPLAGLASFFPPLK